MGPFIIDNLFNNKKNPQKIEQNYKNEWRALGITPQKFWNLQSFLRPTLPKHYDIVTKALRLMAEGTTVLLCSVSVLDLIKLLNRTAIVNKDDG
jgi:hypothetical protein